MVVCEALHNEQSNFVVEMDDSMAQCMSIKMYRGVIDGFA